MSNYCALPFCHTTIGTTGDYQICCWHLTPPTQAVNINHHDYQTWNSSKYVAEVRESFKNNQQHPGCQRCWDIEKLGQPSLRLRSLKDYQILKVDTLEPLLAPINIEVQLGNLCNLSCLMCHEASSSAILAENQKLGIAKYKQKDFNWTLTGFENLKSLLNTQPKIVTIRGGEPLYNKDLLRIIEELPPEFCKKTVLHITTNATNWSDRWEQVLSKFALVRFMLSVDAVNELYEYIRYPGVWKEVDANIQRMQKFTNFKLMVNSVVQNLNILSLEPLLDWAKERNLYIVLSQLSVPEYLTHTNLPDKEKSTAIERLRNLVQKPYDPHINKFLTNCLDQLVKSEFDQILWRSFVDNISMRDRVRNNSYKTFL